METFVPRDMLGTNVYKALGDLDPHFQLELCGSDQ